MLSLLCCLFNYLLKRCDWYIVTCKCQIYKINIMVNYRNKYHTLYWHQLLPDHRLSGMETDNSISTQTTNYLSCCCKLAVFLVISYEYYNQRNCWLRDCGEETRQWLWFTRTHFIHNYKLTIILIKSGSGLLGPFKNFNWKSLQNQDSCCVELLRKLCQVHRRMLVDPWRLCAHSAP